MDTLAARGVRQDAVEILPRARRRSVPAHRICMRSAGRHLAQHHRARLPAEHRRPCGPKRCAPPLACPADRTAGGGGGAYGRPHPQLPRTRARHPPRRAAHVRRRHPSQHRLVLTAVRNDDEAPGEFRFRPTRRRGRRLHGRAHYRVRRPATPAFLVAELRRTLVEESLNAMRRRRSGRHTGRKRTG